MNRARCLMRRQPRFVHYVRDIDATDAVFGFRAESLPAAPWIPNYQAHRLQRGRHNHGRQGVPTLQRTVHAAPRHTCPRHRNGASERACEDPPRLSTAGSRL